MRRAAPAAMLGAWLLSAVCASAAMLEGTATMRGRPAADAVVYLEDSHP